MMTAPPPPAPPRAARPFSPRRVWQGLPGPAKGALWMSLAAASFAVMSALVRYLSQQISPLEVAFFRNLFGLAFLLPTLIQAGWANMRTNNFKRYSLRAALGLTSMYTWFIGLAYLPLADATTLSFIAPIIACIFAVVFLGERAGWRRWSAIVVAFGGALLILRPGFQEIPPAAILLLLGTVATAGSVITVKVLSRTEPASAIVGYMGIYMTPISLIPALFVWTTPSWDLWPWIVLMGAAATLGQWGMTQAYAAADATVVLPFDYVRLPIIAVIAYFIFAETPDAMTYLGGLIIAAATIYIAHRESKMAKKRRTEAAKVVAETPKAENG
ncbi:MAG: DMT family transporter [Alphaproteobacteria bacterium]